MGGGTGISNYQGQKGGIERPACGASGSIAGLETGPWVPSSESPAVIYSPPSACALCLLLGADWVATDPTSQHPLGAGLSMGPQSGDSCLFSGGIWVTPVGRQLLPGALLLWFGSIACPGVLPLPSPAVSAVCLLGGVPTELFTSLAEESSTRGGHVNAT